MRMRSWMLALLLLGGCDNGNDGTHATPVPELLVYCGITMAHPIQDIAAIFERETGARVLVNQGGSEDLYKSLESSRKGDLYLPGSAAYRQRHLQAGLLGDYAPVGYNQAAIIVATGNPLGLGRDLRELTRRDLRVVIGNANTGSIGNETRRILSALGIYDEVLKNVVYLTTDSRNLNRAIRDGEADVILNWRATAFFDENRPFMEVIDLDIALAEPKKLLLNQLTFSAYPELSRQFMELAASARGQAVFRQYGFLDNNQH